MQYDLDTSGEFTTIFQTIRKILLSYPEIKELKNKKQTSYSDQYGVIIMLRVKHDDLVVAFGKGSRLQEKFPQLQGTGKIVRHLYFKSNDKVDDALLRQMIEESIILGIEYHARKELLKQSKATLQ